MHCGRTGTLAPQLVPHRPCLRATGLRKAPNVSQLNVSQLPAARRPCKQTAYASAAAAQTDVRLPRWEDIHRVLTVNENLQSVTPERAAELIEQGWVLVDVRPSADYEKAHPEGAVNVKLFQRVNFRKPSFAGVLRAAALMANGVTPIEQNPDFLAQLATVGGAPRPKVILACEAGGVLDPSTSFPFGKESRSLKAAFKALRGGQVEEVVHRQGGVYGWWRADLPFVGEYSTENIGRTPSAVDAK